MRTLAGTTQEGTDEEGIKAAARALGYGAIEHWGAVQSESWDWLRGAVASGKPVVLCLDAWQHWAVALGMLGDMVVVYDPSNFKRNRAEGGIHVMDRKTLMYRWVNGRKAVERHRRLYAIAITK